MTVVAFNFSTWTALYPEFSAVDPSFAQVLWGDAGNYVDNTDSSPVRAAIDGGNRDSLLYAVLSHIAWLKGQGSGNARAQARDITGRISDTTQGSVSVSTELNGKADTPGLEFWSQTQYGLEFWQKSALWRTSIYVAPCGPLLTGPGRSPWDFTA
jgi:hypothetical protein